MDKEIKINSSELIEDEKLHENSLMEIAEGLLFDSDIDLQDKNFLNVPISELATLGSAVSSLIPSLRTVTNTTTINTEGLCRVVNAGPGDTLKVAKNGDSWGILKTESGKSKFARFREVNNLEVSTQSVSAINPATMMIAVALFSIEQKLGDIEEMQKEILSFLEIEKESEIEADVETLSNMVFKYKLNWDNDYFVSSNHKLVLDIQRTARKNMTSYQKKITEMLKTKKILMTQNRVNSTLKDMIKKFRYYRLSLYTFSMASMMEIMLSGNFEEEYISGIKENIENLSEKYRYLFESSSIYLEKISGVSMEANMLKGIGSASKSVGKFIGSIPMIKKGTIDEFLQESGETISSNAKGIEKSAIIAFGKLNNPETRVFIDRMEDFIKIYNHTENIYFDNENIYLVLDNK